MGKLTITADRPASQSQDSERGRHPVEKAFEQFFVSLNWIKKVSKNYNYRRKWNEHFDGFNWFASFQF